MLSLKPLSPSAIPAALAKAERYRLLSEPAQAESICEDVLAADPDNRQALVTLILAITDGFSSYEGNRVRRAQELSVRLPGEYEREYYAGLVAERRARALLHRGGTGGLGPAGDWLRQAMKAYERAELLRPPDNDDALLRWNACVRFCRQHPGLLQEEESRTAPVMLE